MNYSSALAEHNFFDIVSKESEKLGVQTFVIGGWVRDLVLNRMSNDVDFVCVGSGIELATAIGQRLGLKVSVFKRFGTAMIRYNDWELEFVGARKESYRADSRKPIVEDGSLTDDQNRRDFTINAMGISLSPDTFGDLVDPFGGLQDLNNKVIKTPLEPGITFSDDPLRMMRAVRFASQLGFDIDAETYQGIVDNVSRINIVSQERIVDELNKIVLSPIPSYGFKLLFQCGLLKLIFPEMVRLHGVETINKRSHKDNFYHTLQVLDNLSEMSDDLWLRWAAILHDIAKPATKRFNKKGRMDLPRARRQGCQNGSWDF